MNLAWYVSRAAGLVSWAILALSVIWGLLLSSSVLGRHPGPKWLLDVHRFLGGLSIVFVAVHVLALLADQYVSFTPTQILVPLTSSYRPAAVAAGVVALYLLLAVELTSLVRTRIPRRLWRGVHLLSYGLFVMGTIHLLAAGTDNTSPAVLVTVLVTSTVVVLGTVAHVLRRRAQPRRPARRASTPRPVPAPPRAPGSVSIDLTTSNPSSWTFPEQPPWRDHQRREPAR